MAELSAAVLVWLHIFISNPVESKLPEGIQPRISSVECRTYSDESVDCTVRLNFNKPSRYTTERRY